MVGDIDVYIYVYTLVSRYNHIICNYKYYIYMYIHKLWLLLPMCIYIYMYIYIYTLKVIGLLAWLVITHPQVFMSIVPPCFAGELLLCVLFLYWAADSNLFSNLVALHHGQLEQVCRLAGVAAWWADERPLRRQKRMKGWDFRWIWRYWMNMMDQ